MKTVIQRALPLTQAYTLTDKKYIPLEEGYGQCCDNCGKLIANIATVKGADGKSYCIGFDCLETLLINNSLLSSGDIAEYEKAKKMIPKVIRFAKRIKEVVASNREGGVKITGLHIEPPPSYYPELFTFYWLTNGQTRSRHNENIKLKDVEPEFLLATLKNIFPAMTFIYEK